MTNTESLKANIKQAIEANKLNIGSETTKKLLAQEKLQKIMVASNCREDLKQDINHYAAVGNIEIENLDMDSEELGIMCKKNFNVAVVSIQK